VKILVPIKRVVDYNVKIKVNAAQTDVDTQHVKMSINPFCEIALEEALRLREAGVANEVVIVSIGTDAVIEQLRTGLALGADRAIHVQAPDQLEALHVAKTLHKVVANETPELIILGKQAIDSDNNQTGQMLAALAGMGQGTFASQVMVKDNAVNVTREVDGGLQTLALALPAVVTTDLRLNEPRYATLPNIMKAKRKPIDTTSLDELGIVHKPMLSTIKVEPPKMRQAGVRVESVDELIHKLKTEAKVIA
jgi:electron transfer flavoprotein beta subunit